MGFDTKKPVRKKREVQSRRHFEWRWNLPLFSKAEVRLSAIPFEPAVFSFSEFTEQSY